jgi:linoleoyl-CoA desaturase
MDDLIGPKGRGAGRGAAVALALWVVAWIAVYAGTMVLFAVGGWWALFGVVPLAGITLLLSLAFMHEGSHKSISGSSTVLNSCATQVLALFGVSASLWRLQHISNHHVHTNVPGSDPDLEPGPFFRFHDGQAYYPWHRVQHWYAPILYSILVLKWLWFGDFFDLASNRYKLRWGKWLAISLEVALTRALHLMLWLGIPFALGADPIVLLVVYLGLWSIVGLVLSLVFQAAHVGTKQVFPETLATGPTGMVKHQLATTADFARKVHNELVKVLAEEGLEPHVYKTFWAAIVDHFAHLRRLAHTRPQAALA